MRTLRERYKLVYAASCRLALRHGAFRRLVLMISGVDWWRRIVHFYAFRKLLVLRDAA